MYKFFKISFTNLLIFFATTSAFAAPSISGISGASSHKQQLVINGQNFGNHADFNHSSSGALNTGWIDFESGLTNEIFKHNFNGSLAKNWSLEKGGKTNSSSYAKKFYSGDRRGALSLTMSNDTTGEFYVSFWFMMPSNTQSGKFWRLYWGPNSARDDFYLSTGCKDYMIRGYSETGAGPTQWTSPNSFKSNQWHRVEFLASRKNGTFTSWMDGKKQWTRSDWWTGGTYDPAGHTMDFGHMIDGPGLNGCTQLGSYNFDDIFVNYTLARVEIGDSPTWDTCTKKEVQIPVSWSNNSVSINFNQGIFAQSQKAYLYVVDANGGVNQQGYPITIGGSGSDAPAPAPPPAAPENLIIVQE